MCFLSIEANLKRKHRIKLLSARAPFICEYGNIQDTLSWPKKVIVTEDHSARGTSSTEAADPTPSGFRSIRIGQGLGKYHFEKCFYDSDSNEHSR